MENGAVTVAHILRMIGFLGIGVGAAWAFQILGLASHMTAGDKLLWVMGAASVAGASFGLIVVADAFKDMPVTVEA